MEQEWILREVGILRAFEMDTELNSNFPGKKKFRRVIPVWKVGPNVWHLQDEIVNKKIT